MNYQRKLVPGLERARGATLLEVLIALLVLMTGMLALAGVQSLSFANNHSAYLRAQAVIQAHDMADRLYANWAGVQNGSYSALSGTPSSSPDCLTTSTSADVLEGIDCSLSDIARFDWHEWQSTNSNVLPSGQGTVTGPDANGAYTITLTWLEQEAGGTDVKSFAFQVKPLP